MFTLRFDLGQAVDRQRMASLYRHARVLRHDEADGHVTLDVEIPRRFAERLGPLLKQGGVFAAFGALHLHGARGVPALLERGGFRVTRVR